jgi:predicted membrane metal-binding protein
VGFTAISGHHVAFLYLCFCFLTIFIFFVF